MWKGCLVKKLKNYSDMWQYDDLKTILFLLSNSDMSDLGQEYKGVNDKP